MSVTKFGKMIRSLRLAKGVNLKEMADSFEVSSAYLSSLELGKKNVPSDFITRIKGYFHLNEITAKKLQTAAEESLASLKIDLKQDNEFDRVLVSKFARTYKALDDEKKRKIEQILQGE